MFRAVNSNRRRFYLAQPTTPYFVVPRVPLFGLCPSAAVELTAPQLRWARSDKGTLRLLTSEGFVSRLSEGERLYRDKMFQQGLLWCAGHKQFEPVKDFRKYQEKDRPHHTNYGYRFYCTEYETGVQNPARAERSGKLARERNNGLKKYWVSLAGGCCQRCGFSEFPSALEFHHVYPAAKKYHPSNLIFNNNKEKIWKELDKCCLLCSICHRAYKAREWRAEFIKRDNLLGWTVGDSLPLDDNRYEATKPPAYKQTPLPIFTYEQQSPQLALFETRPVYTV